MAQAPVPVPVTFVSSSAEIGGAELLLVSLLDSLGPDWVEKVVIPAPGELAERVSSAGHRVEIVQFGRRLGLLLAAVRLRRLLNRHPAGIVHANGSRAALVGTLAAGRRRGIVWLRVDRTLDGRVGAWIARRCARVVAISHNTLEGLGDAAAGRAEVVYPGVPDFDVDRKASREFARSLLDCPPDAELIVLSGRLGPAKGQSELLTAAPAVFDARPAARIVFLGGPRAAFPGYAAELRDRARALGIESRVHFLGHRPSGIGSVADAVRLVSGCDLLVAPSRREPPYGWQEGFGLAVAEAMRVGTPVVAYRNGSLPEVIGDCGELVSEGDTAGLAAAITAVLDDPQRREHMASCGRERAVRYFRRDDAVAALRAVYAATAADRARAR